MGRRETYLRWFAAGVFWLAASAGSGRACGLEWLLPANHFDGVNEGGYVNYWERIGSVALDDGVELPLSINFSSERESASPYLGRGWMIPLLESHFEQLSDTEFKMVQPDGWNLYFSRGSVLDTTLEAGGAWKAEIQGDTITAWVSCGWKLVFRKGRLAAMTTPKGHRVEWIFEDGRVTSLREDGKECLRVNAMAGTEGPICSLYTGVAKLVEFQQAKAPWVKPGRAGNVVEAAISTLGRAVFPDGKTHSYELTIDNQKGNTPKLDISSSIPHDFLADGVPLDRRTFTWDAGSKCILSDSPWTYKTKPRSDGGREVSIERKIEGGASESWDVDRQNGVETRRDLDGATTVTSRFMSGKMLGRLRKVVRSQNGKQEVVYRAAFDDVGHLIKQEDGKNVSRIIYHDGEVAAIDRFGSGFVNVSKVRAGSNYKYHLQKGGRNFFALVDERENILEFYEGEERSK